MTDEERARALEAFEKIRAALIRGCPNEASNILFAAFRAVREPLDACIDKQGKEIWTLVHKNDAQEAEIARLTEERDFGRDCVLRGAKEREEVEAQLATAQATVGALRGILAVVAAENDGPNVTTHPRFAEWKSGEGEDDFDVWLSKGALTDSATLATRYTEAVRQAAREECAKVCYAIGERTKGDALGEAAFECADAIEKLQ